MKIAINGFGRIGKNFLRALLQDPASEKKINVVSVNVGNSDPAHVAHLFKYDSICGHYPGTVVQKEGFIVVDGHEIEILNKLDASEIDWKSRAIEWVVDCSGKYTKREQAQKHINSGARKVLISAPAHGEDISIIPGVNDVAYNSNNHAIVSLGSCTTNALLPILKILLDDWGLHHAVVQTVHAYTPSQPILDGDSKDLRKARAGAINIIPTSSGALQMVTKIIPELERKIVVHALRVPLPIVSFLTVTATCTKLLAKEILNESFEQYAATTMKGILDICYEPLVSSDYIQSPYSVTIDGLLTTVINNNTVVASGWYDNEWGYSLRLKDFLLSTF